MNSARTGPATGSFRGGFGGRWHCDRERRAVPRPIPPATGSGTARPACSAARTARRTTTCCAAPMASERVLKTKEVGIALAPGDGCGCRPAAAAAGGRRRSATPAARARDARGRARLMAPMATAAPGIGLPHRHRCRRHLHRCGRHRRRWQPDPGQGRQHPGRPERGRHRRAAEPRRRAGPDAGRRCCGRPSASSTAPPSPPTPCWNARAPRWRC